MNKGKRWIRAEQVVALMRQGWTLKVNVVSDPNAWLVDQHESLASDTIRVHRNTFQFLRRTHRIVSSNPRAFPIVVYRLVVK